MRRIAQVRVEPSAFRIESNILGIDSEDFEFESRFSILFGVDESA